MPFLILNVHQNYFRKLFFISNYFYFNEVCVFICFYHDLIEFIYRNTSPR
jgi:hypothetical protein